jgi:hypothetical protein
MEGYGELTGITEENLYLNYEGEKTGPIRLTREIISHLKKGVTVNLVVVRKGKTWYHNRNYAVSPFYAIIGASCKSPLTPSPLPSPTRGEG